MVILLGNATISTPSCDIYSDGSKYYSCTKTSNTTKDDLSSIEVPLYDFSYMYILCTAFFFVFACFLSDDYYNPFTLRYMDDSEDMDYKFEDLTRDVVKLIRFKSDLIFVVKYAAKHLFDIVHMLVHVILTYIYSFCIALNMGYTGDEAKYEFFPSVKKCSFDHWPFQAECNVGYGSILKGAFIILWIWYFIMSLIVACYIMNKFWKYFQTRKELRYSSFPNTEAWLVYMCKDKKKLLNRKARFLRMKSFEDAAKRLVLEPVVKKLAPEILNMDIEMELLLPIMSNPWASLDSHLNTST